MLLAYLTLFSGLFISAVAIYYSVSGLTAIFAASVIPIIIMGTSLEVGKLVASVWLKQNWSRAPKMLRGYLISAVAILMLITSMGIFGYLSKAHTDQSLVSGDVMSKIAVYDDKIKTAKDNIDANRKALKQMDDAVDQVMARSTTEGGADKAVQIRKGQQKERARLLAEISSEQKTVASVAEARAPIAAEVRKVEAEVGPIKYIAAFIYGDNPDENVLEKAVRWVIILIVIVFDPLAVILLLASQYSFEYERKKKTDAGLEIFAGNPDIEMADPEEFFDRARDVAHSIDGGYYVAPVYPPTGPITSWTTTTYEPDDGALTDEQIELIRTAAKDELPKGEVISKDSLFEEEFPFRGKGVQPGMPLTASYVQPKDKELIEELVIDEPIPEESSPVVTDMGGGYVSVDGKVYHHKAFDQHSESAKHAVDKYNTANPMSMDERPGDYVEEPTKTYVQNEEQAESGAWTKIVSKPISEDEYLEAAKNRTTKKED